MSEPEIRVVEADMSHVAPDSRINRRFVAPGVEHNTGTYETHKVQIRDGRPIADRFSLDVEGFTLARRPSAIADFFDKEAVDRLYPDEVVETVKALTGASAVAPMGWMIRTSGDLSRFKRETVGYSHKGGVQPPAGEAHVDFTPDRADRVAQTNYERCFPNGPGYKRFIASSLWRAFSEPPQDCPLAVCDARSVGRDEGMPNTLHIVDALPDEATMLGPMDTSGMMAAAIFPYSPAHRWWYFSKMTADEVLLFKFHDSEPGKALRTPHTAFWDTSFPEARTRVSIEFRTVAYFE
jgi:hypothetical protein